MHLSLLLFRFHISCISYSCISSSLMQRSPMSPLERNIFGVVLPSYHVVILRNLKCLFAYISKIHCFISLSCFSFFSPFIYFIYFERILRQHKYCNTLLEAQQNNSLPSLYFRHFIIYTYPGETIAPTLNVRATATCKRTPPFTSLTLAMSHVS